MTDNEIERFLNLLQRACNITQCVKCPFDIKGKNICMFDLLGEEIACEPCAWNVKYIMDLLLNEE